MKLSEAIRLGAMNRPQGFYRLYDQGRTCAMGAAAEAMGILDHENNCYIDGHKSKIKHWTPVAMTMTPCPACEEYGIDNMQRVMVHLNNDHRWSRERIADWVETIEPKE